MNKPDRLIESELASGMRTLGVAAKTASRELALASTAEKNLALTAAAAAMRAATDTILAANARDLDAATARGTTGAFLDRLALDGQPILDPLWKPVKGKHRLRLSDASGATLDELKFEVR